MKSVGKTIGRAILSLAVLTGTVGSPLLVVAETVLPETGWNYVATRNCVDTRTGISINTTYSETPVALDNGIQGEKMYTFTCVEPFTYVVRWKPAVDPDVQNQPTISLFTTSLDNSETLAVQKQSLRHGLSYGSVLSIKTVPTTTAKISLNALSQSTGLQYEYVWESDTAPIRSYTESELSGALAGLQTFSSSSDSAIVLTDSYRGKYLVVYAVVRNNDGFSAVRNMPYEVDDVVPLALYIASAQQPVEPVVTTPVVPTSTVPTTPTTPSSPQATNPSVCHPVVVDDGSVTLCRNEVITHTPTGIRVTVKRVHSRYALVRLENANRKTLVVRQGYTYYLRGDNGRSVRVSYSAAGRNSMLTFATVDSTLDSRTVKPNIGMSCGNSTGGDGLYSGCIGDTITHSPSDVRFLITSYSKDRVSITLFNSDTKTLSVNMGASTTVKSTSGKTLSVSFEQLTTKHGAFVKITENK